MAGSHNDINVLQCSSVFSMLVEGQTPECNFEVNGHAYTKGYYLADGIYHAWSIFMKIISEPGNKKESCYAREKEACRKDVKWTFDVLQARCVVVWHPARTRILNTM
jgi:hypothetical protein